MTTPLSIIVIFTVAAGLVALPSKAVNVKLSEPVYQSAGRYVNTPVEVRVRSP